MGRATGGVKVRWAQSLTDASGALVDEMGAVAKSRRALGHLAPFLEVIGAVADALA
jgi:hypothetical protein